VRRELLDYDLPPELIATHPPAERDGARLLVLSRDATSHAAVRDLDRLVEPGALVVVNDTRVIPARLLGHKVATGGRVEVLLVRKLGPTTVVDGERELAAERWSALGRASKPLRPGARIVVGEGSEPQARARVIIDVASVGGDGGMIEVILSSPSGEPIATAIDACGHVPLPPYMRRADEAADRERYQTVFARTPGAVAAPTAGLHITDTMLDRLRDKGVEVARVTLHVGLGTFQPVTADDLDDHPMHEEVFVVPEETREAIARARERRAPVLAIGTTVVRALESAADRERIGHVRAIEGETRLLIQPGYTFRVVDQLLTNFHLPQSTLLALVAAFAGTDRALAAYRAAIDARYRFYSYGDAMLIMSRTAARGGSS
jgi:S-adenosylmethionine:tRNA ribosyltransferase-isomerase